MTAWWNITPTGAPPPIASAIRPPSSAGLSRSPWRCANQSTLTGSSRRPGTPSGAARASRESAAKPSAARQRPVSAVQRFQGGVKIGSTRVAEQVGQPGAAGLDVAALSRRAARGPELALAPLALVVDVREAVLVQADRRPRAQLARQARVERRAG